jgi:RecB family exonuclease
MMLGIAAHEAVETNFSQKLVTRLDLPPEAVTAAFSDAFDRMVDEVDDDPKETKDQAKDSGVALIEKYQEEVAPTIMPLYVEQEIQFAIDGVPYAGFIDLVDDTGRVRDLKTTRRKPSSRQDYTLAMTGYAVGYRELTGKIETGITLDYMVRTQKPYYYPAATNGPISDEGIATFATILSGVSESVQRGIFLPTGLNSGACSWCGYQKICPAFKAAQ